MVPENVDRILKDHDLEAIEFEPGTTPTADRAAAMLNVEVGQIAKSLLFQGKDGGMAMVVCAGDRKISSGKVKRLIGSKARMADAITTEEVTGFKPGGVCPFGVREIPIYIDISLETYGTVYPAAGTDASGVPMTFDQLLQITDGTPCDVTADQH